MPRVKGGAATVKQPPAAPPPAPVATHPSKQPVKMASATKVADVPAKVEKAPEPPRPAASQRVLTVVKLPDSEGVVGKIINVPEKDRPTQRCVVVQLQRQADGSTAMQVQSLQTNETMLLVEQKPSKTAGLFSGWRSGSKDAPGESPVVQASPKGMTTAKPALPELPKASTDSMPDEVAKKALDEKAKTIVLPPPPPLATRVVAPPAMPEVIKMPAPEDRLPVPVPLVPLATNQPKPAVEPPQPPINSFNTMKSVSMEEVTRPPVVMQAKPEGAKTEAAAAPAPAVEMPARPTQAGPVTPSGWTRAPMVPVTKTAAMAGMKESEALSMQDTVHWLGVLQSASSPMQRDQAVKHLSKVDPQMAPHVVETLANVAQTDAAALVRASAIAALAQAKATSPTALAAIESGAKDKDPRVRDEAQQALATLGVAAKKPAVEQAGHKLPK
jgi:hypothetical protein